MPQAPRSLVACLLILLVLTGIRSYYSDLGGAQPRMNLTRWDAFGYYLYLPATVIYHDHTTLAWADTIDRRYNVTGGDGLPVQTLDNGNRVCKYLGGVAILQTPFFAVAHLTAALGGYPQDGFSPPYQYALGIGALLYTFLALLLLRRLLLDWFRDGTVAWTLLLVALATNLPQYAAVHSGLSHCWIFPLYALVIHTTIRWHERPKWSWALLTGLIIGIATICRPTEAIMLFIPLLWGTQTRESARLKWRLVRQNRSHIAFALAGGILGILPQLLYWKSVTGSFIYDVGSKWVFLNPWFRVLTGWEKGWFIYTPVTILFVLGLFVVKRFAFRYSVLVFCLLNIWVVIAWDDWQYGASYSSRALVQSYPVFSFALAAMLERFSGKRRTLIPILGTMLILLNLFQIWQYNTGVLHHRDMNRAYYSRIFLNPFPTPLDMSLLDVADRPGFRIADTHLLYRFAGVPKAISGDEGRECLLHSISLNAAAHPAALRISTSLEINEGRWNSRLGARLRENDSVCEGTIRLVNPVADKTGAYAFYLNVRSGFHRPTLEVFLKPGWTLRGEMKDLRIELLTSRHAPD